MSVSDGRISRLRVTATVVIALILAVLPLPQWLNIARPYLLLLLVIYWSLSAPRIAGLLFAWLCGLAIDVLKGTTLGQHALAFLLVAFCTTNSPAQSKPERDESPSPPSRAASCSHACLTWARPKRRRICPVSE